MPIQFEPGYTPANLRALLQNAGLTQAAAADILGVDGRTIRKWLADLDRSSHRDMPLTQWVRLLKTVNM